MKNLYFKIETENDEVIDHDIYERLVLIVTKDEEGRYNYDWLGEIPDEILNADDDELVDNYVSPEHIWLKDNVGSIINMCEVEEGVYEIKDEFDNMSNQELEQLLASKGLVLDNNIRY